MAYCENLEGRRLLSAGGFGAGHRAGGPEAGAKDAFTIDFGLVNGRRQSGFASAPDGTQFQFSISGNGTGQAVVDGAGFALTVSGTDSRSSLNVFTDAFGLITSLTVDGSLRSINALDCSIGGDVSIAGTLGSASLFAISSEAGNTIHFDITGAGVATSLGIQLISDVTLTTASPIRSLRVRRWADLNDEPDVINAPSIGQLRTLAGRNVTGSFEADLNLTAIGGTSLGQVNIAGGLNGRDWHSRGGKCREGDRGGDARQRAPGRRQRCGCQFARYGRRLCILRIDCRNNGAQWLNGFILRQRDRRRFDRQCALSKVGTNCQRDPIHVRCGRDWKRVATTAACLRQESAIVRKRPATQAGVFDSDDTYIAEIIA